MKLYIEQREVRTNGGLLISGFAIVDEDGHLVSMTYPTRYMANKVRQELIEEFSDYEAGKGKPPHVNH